MAVGKIEIIETPSFIERLTGGLRYYFPTFLIAVSVILFWEFAVVAFDIQQFLLPKPSSIFAEFKSEVDLWLNPNENSLLFEATGATF